MTGPLNPLAEAIDENADRLSQASTVKPVHSRATSSLSTVSSFLASSGGEGSSGSGSPAEPGSSRSTLSRTRKAITNGHSLDIAANLAKGAQRLVATLTQMQQPVDDVLGFLEASPSAAAALRLCVDEANSNISRVSDMLKQARIASVQPSAKTIVRRSSRAIRAYASVTSGLKRNLSIIVQATEGFEVRCLLLQLYAGIVEARNICMLLGYQVKEQQSQRDTLRNSRAWSSRTVTPTQPKMPIERHPRRPTVLPRDSSSSVATIRPMGPPQSMSHANGSRSATMPSSTTPRSADALSTSNPIRPELSRANTMRSMMDYPDPDDQFEHIYMKLRVACAQAQNALNTCRIEFANRRDHASSFNQPRPAHLWQKALDKVEVVSGDCRHLTRRMDNSDPGMLRYQRDFWQGCDAFVHVSEQVLTRAKEHLLTSRYKSWLDLVTEIKDLGSQRVDVTSAKQIVRNTQKLVKDVSKTISHSSLYHHALGTKMPDSSASPPYTVGPYQSGMNSSTASFASSTTGQNPYITSLPATPLSAALGPAAQAVGAAGGYFQEPLTAMHRISHERVDTVMQAKARRQG